MYTVALQKLAQLRELQSLAKPLGDELPVRFALLPRFTALAAWPTVQRREQRRQKFLRERRRALLALQPKRLRRVQ